MTRRRCFAGRDIQRDGSHQSLLRVGIGLLVRFKAVDALGNAYSVDRSQSAASRLVDCGFAQSGSPGHCWQLWGGASNVAHGGGLLEVIGNDRDDK